jgi:outer membrane protein assembly factor BamA
MKKSIVTLLGLVLLGLNVAVSQGATVVKEIQIKNLGSGQIDEGFILAKIGVKVGMELERQMVAKDVKALLETGRFSGVDVSVDTAVGGAKIVFSVRNKLRLQEQITVDGAEHFRESRIRDLLELQAGDWVDDQVLGVRVGKVMEEYRDDYFPDAKITWRIE